MVLKKEKEAPKLKLKSQKKKAGLTGINCCSEYVCACV